MISVAAASLAACASVQPRYASQPQAQPAPGQKVGKPYQIKGVWYTPKVDPDYDEVGLASWYGGHHQGKPTANGERFDLNRISAAHKTLPLPSIVEVVNLENGKRLKVRVNDRGPFVAGRIIDLSQEAARKLGFENKGLAKVRVRYVGAGETRTAMMDARVE
jgi:rare lipoprotein A